MRAEITVRRTFAASVERVFAALTDPVELVQWWGPRGIRTSAAEIDLRPGGRCRWVMHPEGSTAVLHGTVIDVDPPVLLTMTNQWDGDDTETLVTFRLTSTDAGTELEIHHRRLPSDRRPGEFASAWDAALDSLTDHLTTTITSTSMESPMNPTQTQQIARAYFDAWSTRKGPDVLREFMAEDFMFRAGELTVEGRDAFLSFGGWPEHAETNIVAEAYGDGTAIQIYEATNGDTSVRVADHLTLRDGLIVSSDTICDASSFGAFMAAS